VPFEGEVEVRKGKKGCGKWNSCTNNKQGYSNKSRDLEERGWYRRSVKGADLGCRRMIIIKNIRV
jgi:hypothetical protein